MIFENLSDANFQLFAARAYDSPTNITAEFEEDLSHIKYVKRLLKRYRLNGELSAQLILNHLMVLYNVFNNAATRMLFFKIGPDDYSALKTFLLFLRRLPVVIKGINSKDIDTRTISTDAKILKALMQL